MTLFPTIVGYFHVILCASLLVVVWGWFFLFVSVAMFSKPCLFLLGFCPKCPINYFKEDNSEGSMKNSQIEYLPITLLGLILRMIWCFRDILVKKEITSPSHMETQALVTI